MQWFSSPSIRVRIPLEVPMNKTITSEAIVWLLNITMNSYYKNQCIKSLQQMYEYY